VRFGAGALERLAIVVASLALAVGLIALLSGFFAGRDQAGITGTQTVPGQAFRDLGHALLAPGQPRPAYDSVPPTSGAHIPEPVVRDQSRLTEDQLLTALQLGDVVIAYGTPTPPAALIAFARSAAPAFSAPLAAAGQAVILAREPGQTGLTGLAWAHLLRVRAPADPRLREFVEYWLGRGAP
jgi:hypothetical protein